MSEVLTVLNKSSEITLYPINKSYSKACDSQQSMAVATHMTVLKDKYRYPKEKNLSVYLNT